MNQGPRKMWYDKLPTAKQKAMQQNYADYFRSFPWQLYITFTFANPVGDAAAAAIYQEFVNQLEHYYRAPIGWVRGEETSHFSGLGMPGGRLHYHLLLCSDVELDPKCVEQVWRALGSFGDHACAEKYEPDDEAVRYCFKFLHEPGNGWNLGGLDHFGPEAAGENCRSRRRARRRAERLAAA